ncbi:MAG: peptide chain release factor N(5)-glutamine methyltransferase [Lachnospiraceae bacterium]|nr:peptide chain release factor N(5)-glutamine methyltransferase [Lachnospiraceae bacterium]
MTINELRSRGVRCLEDAGIDDAATDAALLMEYTLKTDRNHILAYGNDEVSDKQADDYDALIKRRAEHVPLQYITGHQEFMGLDFEVCEDVLIPRLDTECLVEEAMIETEDGMRVLDLCTGTGCIIISLARYKNDLKAVGVDISGKAVEIAAGNAESNGVEVCFLQGDLYEALDDHNSIYDAIISNPPYIAGAVIDTLMEEVRDHEPLIALCGGEDGLEFYRRIIDGADSHLVPGGVILFEIGYDQGKAVSDMLREHGYRDVKVVKDLAGLDRVVKAHRPFL